MKIAAASIRGTYLDWWRYPRGLDARVERVTERERWSHSEWATYVDERLGHVMRQAMHAPHYQRLGLEPGPLAEWPVLSKHDLRERPEEMLATKRPRWTMFEDHTSGSTGTPVQVLQKRSTVASLYTLFEARVRRWNGVRRGEAWAVLGGQLVAASDRSRPPYWVWNATGRQLYLSALHISSATVGDYARAIDHHEVRSIVGYPSALAEIADGLLELGRRVSSPRVVICNAEPLSDSQRERIETAFRCPVRNTYGVAEAVVQSSECEHGALHLWPEMGIVEVLRLGEDTPAEPGEQGRLVCTGLVSTAQPLIRYDTGDVGVVDHSTRCPCGRTLPTLVRIEGRLDDLVVAADGRRIGRLDHVFKRDLDIRSAQIIQEDLGRFRVLVVPAAGELDPATANEIERALTERVGRASVAVESVESIPRGAGGKFQGVVSHLGRPDVAR